MSGQTAPTKSGRGKIIAVIVVIVAAGLAGAYYVFYGRGSAGTACASGASSPSSSNVLIPVGTGINTALNFSPQVLTVKMGTNNTITFRNIDNTIHTVTFDSGPCSSIGSIGASNLAAGASYTVTLAAPGTYQYHCTLHNWMSGTIVVKATATTSPSSGY